MFYCDVEPAKGGETPIIRSDQVCDYFFQEFPEFAAEVESKGVKYIRVMPLEDDNTSAIGRSWKSTFQCTTKKEAEDAMTKIGTTWEWLKNGDVRTTSAAVPAIRTDQRSGRKMFFNSMVAAYTGWIDSRNDPTKAIILGDDSAINGAALLKVAKFQRDHRVCFQWKKGDIILIDNFVTMHSRNTFERPRRILAAIGGPSQDGYGKRICDFRLISFICQRNNAKMYLRYDTLFLLVLCDPFFFLPIFIFSSSLPSIFKLLGVVSEAKNHQQKTFQHHPPCLVLLQRLPSRPNVLIQQRRMHVPLKYPFKSWRVQEIQCHCLV